MYFEIILGLLSLLERVLNLLEDHAAQDHALRVDHNLLTNQQFALLHL